MSVFNGLIRARKGFFESFWNMGSRKTQTTVLHTYEKDESLPPKNSNAFRKRPVTFEYKREDYFSFWMPSEKRFLESTFDTQDVFGVRKNTTHSPYIQSQLDLDSNLMWIFFFINIFLMFKVFGSNDEYQNLRYNQLNSDLGRFGVDDML